MSRNYGSKQFLRHILFLCRFDYLRTLQTTEEIYRSNLGKPTLYFILISVITSYDILRQRPVGFSYQNPSVPPVQQFIVR